ncbi:25S rRNA (adenine2142-N1)-methyltransferase [Lithohypha guttulata]|uniref:25S rRNA (adenine2142-N1)-methyltransferase n=1 Tax=Lithohypha guttulata TaxID=1690604 RepID=UPI002DDE4FCF|nr:25S rRNA (adenine2142-N1)-methyltransferase [Lithohypha guttulata]KAK5098783.1 25S rRNA (adenine2142-N1)-methyltransferase [Lithohypha guttulata]
MVRTAKAVKSLKGGRPPLTSKKLSTSNHSTATTTTNEVNPRRKSAKATRKLINTHHQLHKARAIAVAGDNQQLVRDLDTQIEQLGGLAAYQAASLTGQDKDRGGDSSIKLVEWLRKRGLIGQQSNTDPGQDLRVLEIGALSSQNAISRLVGKGVRDVKRIDLHSQDKSTIEEIDFMDLPIPLHDEDKFDIVSLSLVLNYVPDVAHRGNMLRRTRDFLRKLSTLSETDKDEQEAREPAKDTRLPCLFVVLPLPCLSNSRYMTHEHFLSIMQHLGYESIEKHNSQKLAYMLFRLDHVQQQRDKSTVFKKIELRPGGERNNFAIVLAPD